MRPFQISEQEWVNLEHLVMWHVSHGTVYLWLLPNSAQDGHTTIAKGEFAERFIKRMEMLAQGNFL